MQGAFVVALAGDQDLRLSAADRHDEPPAFGQLSQQRLRDGGSGCRNQDPIVRRVGGPTERAVTLGYAPAYRVRQPLEEADVACCAETTWDHKAVRYVRPPLPGYVLPRLVTSNTYRRGMP